MTSALKIKLAGLLALALASCDLRSRPRTIDDFDAVGAWAAGASEGGLAEARVVEGEKRRALQLGYEFPQGAGYAFIRRPIDLDLSRNFEISFRLRGAAPPSTLEVKFLDDSGENVWWRQMRGREFSADWQTVRIRRSDVGFAWGPAADRALHKIAAIEIVIVGSAGEKATLDFDSLSLRRLPEPPARPPAIVAKANTETRDGPASAAVDGDPSTAWRTPSERGEPALLTLDLGYLRDFGGLILDWAGGGAPAEVEASYSGDGRVWTPLHVLEAARARTAYARTKEASGRFIRLTLTPSPGAGLAFAEASVEAPDFGADDSVFLKTLVARSPRGAFPRSLVGEQIYWTIVGAPEGGRTALLSEDGAVEPAPGAFSIEPFVVADGKVRSWADGAHAHWLTENYLPLPHVKRVGEEYSLDVSAYTPPSADADRPLVVRYRLVNQDTERRTLSLLLAVRPFQVNPPTQFLNLPGGASPLAKLQWTGEALVVNETWHIRPSRHPDGVALAAAIDEALPDGELAGAAAPLEVRSADGFGSALVRFEFDLAPGESAETAIVMQAGAAPAPAALTASALARGEAAAADEWRAVLNRIEISWPFAASPIADGVRTALAHILMTRDGPALRPGPRSYARAWIRDGAMMAESLLKLGHPGAAADFARWYAPYQFETGKIPCCVDARGADSVPENDSHGEFIFLAAELYRYTKDRGFAEEMWPHVDRAAAAIDALRLSERTAENAGARKAFYGLLPPSISHEGYSDRPAYSYWDDFWGLEGLKDAAFLAAELGHKERAAELSASATKFDEDIAASIAQVSEMRGLDHIPGAADRGDFDATSTTIALAPTNVASTAPPSMLARTFDKAWSAFLARRDGTTEWDAYTPYEFRQVSAFLRLGRPDRAHALLDFFMRHRRPAGWNQWAEVVGREARAPRFIGDMPHAWVASDFIRAAIDLFAYEDRAEGAMIIAAGTPRAWLEGEGIKVERLMTPYGALSYKAAERGGKIVFRVSGEAAPPGGFRLPTGFLGGDFTATVNDEKAETKDGALRFDALPAEIVLTPTTASGPRAAGPSTAPKLEPGQHAVAMTDAAGRAHRLLLYLPEKAASPETGEKFPLIVFLHGSGERGEDILLVKVHGPPKLVEGRTDFPFIVASPQLAAGEMWNAEGLAGLLAHLLARTPADPDRVYVTGLSLGGYGTWAFGAAYPDRVAAIAPISGAGAPATACALKATPIWSFHGALDDIVEPGGDIAMVEAVNACGGAARLTLYPDLGHDAWTRTYDNPEFYDWLLAHRRGSALQER